MLRIDAGDFVVHRDRARVRDIVRRRCRSSSARLHGHPRQRVPDGLTRGRRPAPAEAGAPATARQRGEVLSAGLLHRRSRATANDGVDIAVRNTGPAIPEREQAADFRALLSRRRQARHVPGTGMGLAIVQQIARAHGGALTVSSTPEAARRSPCRCRTARSRVMSAGRILVVDDDPQIRRVMRVTLTGQGYEVDDAKSGEERARQASRRALRPRAARHEHAGHGRAGDLPR